MKKKNLARIFITVYTEYICVYNCKYRNDLLSLLMVLSNRTATHPTQIQHVEGGG